MSELLRLDNPIRAYDWGSRTVLAELLGRPASGGPQAELWVGAHPTAPSRLPDGSSLLDRITSAPESTLGPGEDRLPFLLKVLAVEHPLSLQVHPDADQARDGHAGGRGYQDAWPKPELVYALTRFEALCGFADPERAAALLTSVRGERLGRVADVLTAGGPRAAVTALTTWPEHDRRALVAEVGRSTVPGLARPRRLAERHPADPGVVIAVLMNHVTLDPGQALFARPRTLHAYLCGTGVEIMANSDNVVRGGLTTKHVDVAELRAITDFSPSPPELVAPVPLPNGETSFPTPTPYFRLTRLQLSGTSVEIPAPGPSALLCLDGDLTVTRGTAAERLRRGGSVFLPAAGGPATVTGHGLAFRASLPR
ncbi:mannose-6-phosphate isomerase, class I [Streptomyces sp. NPDC005828]|uniref:mannose-6-phosphate isomerase, class I n=1 Tax=Streptomyces sp. NPDC005828 TaxID=3157071 RepID=UPI0033F44785